MSFDFQSVRKQPVNFHQINKVLQKAWKSLELAKTSVKISADDSFVLAYESMLKTSLALMLSRGYRPKVQLGHHKTLIGFARYILKNFNQLANTYDKIRKKRNKIIYEIVNTSESETKYAITIAEKYFKIVEAKIAQDNPQQKLWKPYL